MANIIHTSLTSAPFICLICIVCGSCDRDSSPTNLDTTIQHNDVAAIQGVATQPSLNAIGKDGFTPLGRAVAEGRFEVVQALLAKGADPDAPGGGKGDTAHALMAGC